MSSGRLVLCFQNHKGIKNNAVPSNPPNNPVTALGSGTLDLGAGLDERDGP